MSDQDTRTETEQDALDTARVGYQFLSTIRF